MAGEPILPSAEKHAVMVEEARRLDLHEKTKSFEALGNLLGSAIYVVGWCSSPCVWVGDSNFRTIQ